MKPSFRQGETTSPERPLLEEPIPRFPGLPRIEKAHRRGPNVRPDEILYLSLLRARSDNCGLFEPVDVSSHEVEADPVSELNGTYRVDELAFSCSLLTIRR